MRDRKYIETLSSSVSSVSESVSRVKKKKDRAPDQGIDKTLNKLGIEDSIPKSAENVNIDKSSIYDTD